MSKILLSQATITNEGQTFEGSLLIEHGFISKIFTDSVPESIAIDCQVVDAKGKWLIPGVIDDHVHFRDPGLTHKADLETESKAAIAGGVTSFMEMPNTQPLTVTVDAWTDKMALAKHKSWANYAFFMGATNDNLKELEQTDYTRSCGVKVFMGASTGNMLVGQQAALEGIFKAVKGVVVVHAESEAIIQANKKKYVEEFGEDLPIKFHSLIRTAEACYESSALAVALATKWGTRLHLAHVSTAKELSLFSDKPLKEKNITAEVCVPHLWFDDRDYDRLGNKIKCNPSIKSELDKFALREGLKKNLIDVIATDHAPHTLEDKVGNCLVAASGMPSIQFALPIMLELVRKGDLTKELVVEKMCHAPAQIFKIDRRGFIREGYYADFVIVDLKNEWTCEQDIILSKCGWSPYEKQVFHAKVIQTWVNGALIFDNGFFANESTALELKFLI